MTPTPPADPWKELRELMEDAVAGGGRIIDGGEAETILALLVDWKRLHDGFLKGDALMVEADEAIAKAEASLRKSEERAADLTNALNLALCWLVPREPGDSRAVSDEFVAMSAVAENLANDSAREIIARATLANEATDV